jgi:hypothetical protein
MLHFNFITCIIYFGGDGMKNKFMKILGVSLSCLALTLLLNVATTDNSSKVLTSNIHIDELAPWG